MERPKIELGIIIAGLRRLLVVIGHFLVGRGVGNSRAEVDQHSEAASNYNNRSLHGLRNRVATGWPQGLI
ncbi:hypothetical protein ACF1BQ_041270 [Bradyrhizobium sp. RDT10]